MSLPYQPVLLGRSAEFDVILTGEFSLGKDCARCSRKLVRASSWSALTKKQRATAKEHYSPLSSRDLCKSCYNHLHRDHRDDLADYERNTVELTVFAEEYNTFHQSGMTDQHIAEKLGLFRPASDTPSRRMSTFDKALERAKKAGLIA